MAEITVVTTSWRLLDTNVFGVHAGACYPTAYPAAPSLWRGKDHQWTAVRHCALWLTALLCHVSLHNLPSQSCLTVHCKSKVVNLCLPSLDLFMFLHVVLFVWSLFLLLLTATWSTAQGFARIRFVIRCCPHFWRFEIFSRWHPVDRPSILPSMHKITFWKRHLYVSVLFFSTSSSSSSRDS